MPSSTSPASRSRTRPAVDVYENTATNNSGGILVFNLPGLQVYGQRTRVYDNLSFENNTPNFAPAGNIVAGVPTGTGLMVLANDKVEVFGNTFRDNNTSQITMISYNTAAVLGGLEVPDLPEFDPFSESLLDPRQHLHRRRYDARPRCRVPARGPDARHHPADLLRRRRRSR